MSKKGFTAKRIRKGIKLDRVSAQDYSQYDFIFACEQCSHFCSESETCTIGYQASQHRRELQMKRFNHTGHMALCRFIEID